MLALLIIIKNNNEMFNLLLGNSTSFPFPFPLSFIVGVFVDDVGIDLALLELGVPEN